MDGEIKIEKTCYYCRMPNSSIVEKKLYLSRYCFDTNQENMQICIQINWNQTYIFKKVTQNWKFMESCMCIFTFVLFTCTVHIHELWIIYKILISMFKKKIVRNSQSIIKWKWGICRCCRSWSFFFLANFTSYILLIEDIDISLVYSYVAFHQQCKKHF